MPSRLPTPTDFPSPFILSITPPPPSQQPVNILLLLHGLGDTNASFTTLGTQLALPETACISLQAPTPLPFDLGGFHWGDDLQFDSATGQMDVDLGFKKAVDMIGRDVIESVLMEKCGYSPRNIILFGFGQGGMAAVATAHSLEFELGGVVSIGGPLLSSCSVNGKSTTPTLVLGGSSNTVITKSAVSRFRTAFQTVQYHKWGKSGDGMPGNREEMLPIMKFFARRLRSRSGVPEGSVEVG
ncbi:MAG: hypothetical protein HETSPECPRED_010391 [Heterodermia speciosa]|uniref:Phospholipase/carboxylesterase/thioesterase domain-containing protein n=1 Tax=Heterodermia speciosa TaxID=116794 RepID=A0A8H3GBE4_9LECA|nr:MAG: hypothetical protein HETSPECPRED_010391 [Heterodermia speciosa]